MKKMYIVWITWLILCFSGLNLASNCFYSENIQCSCDIELASCNGFQHELSEVQDVLANVSNNYSSKDLLYLNLNIKNLTFPNDFTFSDFKLKNLSLGYELKNIHDDLFSGLSSSLTSLSLQLNNIPFMNNKPFSELHNLKELKFEYNELYSINSEVFLNLSNLEFLSLSGNKLSQVGNDLLANLAAIQELVLNNNNLSSLSSINIESSTLKKLVIQNCSTNGSLTKEFLRGVNNLEYADFSWNQLIGVDSYALSALSQLKILNLSDNLLEKLEQNAFSSLYNLISLDLKDNKLSYITKTSFLNLTNLKYLDISGNMLQAVLSEYTSDLYSLENINLRNNKIKIVMAGAFSTTTNLQKLFLIGNTWDCICELSYFVEYLVNNSHTIEIEDSNELKCTSPSNLRDTPLIKMDFIPLNCDNKEETEDDYDYETETTELGTTDSMASMTTINSSVFLFTTDSDSSPTTEKTQSSTVEIRTTTENSIHSTEIDMTTKENLQSSTVLIGSTRENLITATEMEDTSSVTPSLSTQSSTFSATTIPIKITTTLVPKVGGDILINILDYTIKDKDFCIRWSATGLTLNKPTCSVKINSREGSKSKNLKCPTDENEIQQCISSKEIYEFCINIYVKAVRISKACSKVSITTTSKYTEVSTEATSPSISTTKSIDLTTNQLIPKTSLIDLTTNQQDPKISLSDGVVFKVTKFDVIFYSNSTASLMWTVNKNEPESVCKLAIILAIYNYNRTEGIFKCSNNTYQMKNMREQDSFRVCLVITHKTKSNLMCKSYTGLSYELKGSRTKDDGYKNSSLIAVLCLLVVVTLIIIVIILKNLLKKRIEADRYNVYEEEQNVQKRMSTQFQQEPCVRYSYTLTTQREV